MRIFFHRLHEAVHRHHHHHHMSRRGRGFAGFGGRGGFGDGPSGAGFDGFNGGRKLGSADLQLLLLTLLAERPSHGYELIKILEERSNGYYVPSPGMVYPALTYLEELGHASVEQQGSKKLYRVTDTGLTYLEGRRAEIDALLEQLAYIGQRMEDVRRAMGRGDVADDAADFDAPQTFDGRGRHAAGAPEVRAARRNLKSALIAKSGASLDEQRRIALILERAAAEIRDAADNK
ncbi:MAG: PadR family transcriptional regulator [Verrucomicrobiaceae bacterium]|nr:PadR family transcriptional regulator [Verrucomicrobiaceae bacterium]